MKTPEKTKLQELLKTHDIIKSGFGGMLPNGNLVDRRQFPNAIPLQKNTLFKTPKPKDITEKK